MAKSMPVSSPSGSAAACDDGSDDMDPADKAASDHHKALDEHKMTAHKHLRAAHGSTNPHAIKHHIQQAGMAVNALHKTAKSAAIANGKSAGEYDRESGGGYGQE